MELNRTSSEEKKIEGPQSPSKETTAVNISPLLDGYNVEQKVHADDLKHKIKKFLRFISLG
jgi:hypothetical protein